MEGYRSHRSVKSIKSLSAMPTESGKVTFEDPFVLTFEENLRDLCLHYQAPFELRVIRDLQRIEPYTHGRKMKPRRTTFITPLGLIPSEEFTAETEDTTTVTSTTQASFDDDTLVVKTVYDSLNRLVEISMTNQKEVPRALLQVIQLLGSSYPFLTRLIFKRCRMNKYTTYEVARIVDVAPITELYFDDSISRESNYAMVLEKTTSLRVLSLARCDLTDLVCEQIANKLTYFEPASKNLLVLNLSSNRITDEGAKCFAFFLRSNRSLRHLNLSGNQITDVGAITIFESLMIFPLTYDEYIGKRTRYSNHVRQLLELSKSFLAERVEVMNIVDVVAKPTSAQSDKHKAKKTPSPTPAASPVNASKPTPVQTPPPKPDDLIFHRQRAEMLASEVTGPFIDPFGARSTIFRDGYRYCIGNLALSSLNLSFNSLCYPSLKKLEEVVKFQRGVRQINQSGLLRLVIDGNYLPADAVEYRVIGDILGRYMGSRPSRKSEMSKRRSRPGNIQSKVQLQTTRD